MAIEDALVALREHWDDVMSHLDEAQGERLRALIANLGGPDHVTAVTHLADLLVEGLPPRHTVRKALTEGYLLVSPDIDVVAISLELRGKAVMVSVSDVGPRSPGWILRSVVERLLRSPALTAEEVRRRDTDPADPSLIRLDRDDGDSRWPDFQFSPAGGPLPVVRTVNQVLGAAADPVGAADWWLSKNAWLDAQPSRLIGQVPDDVLIQAARAVRSEV
jgi:hypothetical protein